MMVLRAVAMILSLGVQSSAFSPFARALGRPNLATRASPVAATHGTSDDEGAGGVSRRGVLGAAAGLLAGTGLVPMGPALADIDLKGAALPPPVHPPPPWRTTAIAAPPFIRHAAPAGLEC